MRRAAEVRPSANGTGGRRPCQVSSKLLLDPDLCMCRKDYRYRLLCGVFGGLIRMFAPPGCHSRSVTFYRWTPRATRQFERLQYRARSDISRRIDFRDTPNHQALQRLRRRLFSWLATINGANITAREGFRPAAARFCILMKRARPWRSKLRELRRTAAHASRGRADITSLPGLDDIVQCDRSTGVLG